MSNSNTNFVVKLTPNKKEAILNTSVLLNGYKDVQYPLSLINTGKIGYVIDGDTFQFVDPSVLADMDKPYPIQMDIELEYDEIPFYAFNKHYDAQNPNPFWSYAPRWYYYDETEPQRIPKFYKKSNDNIIYDQGIIYVQQKIIKHNNVNKYQIGYKIIFNIYWSDNKSHATTIDYTSDDTPTRVYPFVGNLYMLSIDNDSNQNQINAEYANIVSIIGGHNHLIFSENLQTTSPRDVIQLTVAATFTDPSTGISVTNNKSFTMQQQGYQGGTIGYVRYRYLDCKPLELWTPKVQIIDNQSYHNEANIYINKRLKTEYAGFIIDSTWDISTADYSQKLYKRGVMPYNYDGNSSYIDDVDTLKEALQYFNDNKNLRGVVNLSDVSLNNFYMYDTSMLYLDASYVFNDIDFVNFQYRFNQCTSCAIDTSKNHNSTKYGDSEVYPFISYPYKNSEYVNSSLYDNDVEKNVLLTSDMSQYAIKISGQYNARYAKFIVDDDQYKQVIDIEANRDVGLDNLIVSWDVKHLITRDNIDCSVYGINYYNDVETTTSKKEITDIDALTNYTQTLDTDGRVVQYKYCINDLFEPKYDDAIQVPTFAAYPIYDIIQPINIIAGYDYENPGNIIYIDCSNCVVYSSDTDQQIYDKIGVKLQADCSIKWGGLVSDDFLITNNRQMLRSTNMLYGNDSISTEVSITLPTEEISQLIKDNLRINGLLLNDIVEYNVINSSVEPHIFTLSLDNYYPEFNSSILSLTLNNTNDINLLLTNDENEKHLRNYTNEGKDINTGLDSYMLLRTNPKLTGNIKLVVDTDYNLYLDTFKASPRLNDYTYRKKAVSSDGNYPHDVKTVFSGLPATEIFKIPDNSFKAHKVYSDFNDQYETMYEYGAETNKDNLYNENMKILAPLHIGKDVPDFFAIFRYDDILNKETFKGEHIKDTEKFLTLLKDSKVIKTFDLREYTSIGQYLNNYKNMLTNYGQCYLQFIEQDNHINSYSYRQGTNIWKGVSVKRGILADQSETSYFAAKILNSSISNKQELFNNFIMQGFERHNILYPNIINLEFMFNDNEKEEYSMHRYFGLYLSENDFIKYGYAIPNIANKNRLVKYDLDGNVYNGDNPIYSKIFNGRYNDRLFFAITNNDAERVQSKKDIDDFFIKKVNTNPDKNLVTIKSDTLEFDENHKSFITLHFSEPLKYGEHIKFIALNKPIDNPIEYEVHIQNNETPVAVKLTYEHIVFEIIASNDESLLNTENNISPYVNEEICEYSNNTYFYRLTFYTQDLTYNNISASLQTQIDRIVQCINKFDSFIHVASWNNDSISIVSDYDEMYVQHIAEPNIGEFSYDYLYLKDFHNIIITNKDIHKSLDYFENIYDTSVSKYEQTNNINYEYLKKEDVIEMNQNKNDWHLYVETEDPVNIKQDTISYFNPHIKYDMHGLSNQSDYFDGYYAAFSNYGFETIGWRYNTVVKFINISDLNNSYTIYDDVYDYLKAVKYPMVMTDDNFYETIDMFNIDNGYLRNNIVDPDIYEAYTTKQQFIFTNKELQVVTSPYNVNYNMLCSRGDALLKNNFIQLYKPKPVNIAIMGINNIKDIDTVIDYEKINHNETNLRTIINAGEKISLDETDYRLQHGVVYKIVTGSLLYNDVELVKDSKFMLIPGDNETYTLHYTKDDEYNKTTSNNNELTSKSYTVIEIIDKQYYQQYDFDTVNPMIKSDNLYRDPENTDNSELLYSVVPLTNCNWQSNGQYIDHNEILDVNKLSYDYEPEGYFVENVYTPAFYDVNQYVTNKIDNILYIDDVQYTFKEAIINNAVQHPIKKLLIDNVNIKPAMVYYNSTIQSLEFIFNSVKFTIKLNSKQINSHIHLEDYNNYEVFVLNEYDISKRNELFISQIERFILLINHEFYIEYQHEGDSNIKTLTETDIKAYADYSSFKAPYSLDFRTMSISNHDVMTNKKEMLYDKSLLQTIDEYNLWNSMMIQYDIPNYINDFNCPQFIQMYVQAVNDYHKFINIEKVKGDIGVLQDNKVNSINDTFIIKCEDSTSYPYVITRSDGDYNRQAMQLLETYNDILKKISGNKDWTAVYNSEQEYHQSNTNNSGGGTIYAAPAIERMTRNQLFDNNNKLVPRFANIASKQEYVYKRSDITLITNDTNQRLNRVNDYDSDVKKLQLNNHIDVTILDTLLYSTYHRLITDNTNYIIPDTQLKLLQDYIKILLVVETPKEKLQRYVKSFSNNMDIYIIPVNQKYTLIQMTEEYKPLIFTLSIPNHVKYNHGWFTVNTNNILDFSIDDELKDLLNVDLLQSNTHVTGINSIKNYTGNKVFDDQHLQTLKQNYFLISDRSLLSTTWDNNYYRRYLDETRYVYKEGYKTGIDDKSFFGSRCMVLYNSYILLDTWRYDTANDILLTEIIDSDFNINTTNVKNYKITINLTQALYNHFFNNKEFKENWNFFDDSQNTGMKNYINNTILRFYNLNSNIDVLLYKKDTQQNDIINILTEKPSDLDNYSIYEGAKITAPELKNNFYILTISIPEMTGMNVYPNIKIYKK